MAPRERPALIAVVGAQGSGKTTLARAAAQAFGGVQISIDDVYLTRAERADMAARVHPLFAMRGPPGTHDLALLSDLIRRLTEAGPEDRTALPDFDKRGDDRVPHDRWRVFTGRPRAILIDAWCLGAATEPTEDLVAPINALEAAEDPDGVWRRAVDAFVAGPYADFAALFDATVFLKAPGFDVVLDWRCQQEADLLGVAPAALQAEERAWLADFIQYFERVTRRMLAGGVRADVVVPLDRNRVPGDFDA